MRSSTEYLVLGAGMHIHIYCLKHENGIDAHTPNHGKSERKRRREYANDGGRRVPNQDMGSLSHPVLPEDNNELVDFLDDDEGNDSFLHQESETAHSLIRDYDDSFSFLGNVENVVDSSNFESVTQVKMNFDRDDSTTTRDRKHSRKTSPASVASGDLIDLTKGDGIARAHDSAITQNKKHVCQLLTALSTYSFLQRTGQFLKLVSMMDIFCGQVAIERERVFVWLESSLRAQKNGIYDPFFTNPSHDILYPPTEE